MIPPKRAKAKLTNKLVLNEKYVLFDFEMTEPHLLEFQAGQYVSIQVSPRGDRRPYSICNAPSINHKFELLVDMEPMGLGVSYLDQLAFGQEVDILAPMGVFTLSDKADEQALVFVATGSGAAPFRSMLLELLQNQHDTREMILYVGLRHEHYMFWQDEFTELVEAFPNFHFHPVISKASDQWPLCKGRVTDCVSLHQQPENAGYYLCGSQSMIEQVATMLAQKGVPATHVHHEKFF